MATFENDENLPLRCESCNWGCYNTRNLKDHQKQKRCLDILKKIKNLKNDLETINFKDFLTLSKVQAVQNLIENVESSEEEKEIEYFGTCNICEKFEAKNFEELSNHIQENHGKIKYFEFRRRLTPMLPNFCLGTLITCPTIF